MSLILDALGKSDRERGVQSVPALHAPDGEAAPERRSWRAWIWPGLTVLFALVALGLWLGGGDAGNAGVAGSPPSTQPSTPPRPAQTPAQPSTQVPEQQSPEQQPPEQAPAAEPAADGERAQIAALYADTGPDEAAPAEPPIDVDSLAMAAQAELNRLRTEDEPLADHPAPLVGDLTQRARNAIPSVFFTMHHWSTVPAEREVVLNGEVRREGDSVASGLKLVEILEDSIVLDYRGTEFRLRALNSWVNL